MIYFLICIRIYSESKKTNKQTKKRNKEITRGAIFLRQNSLLQNNRYGKHSSLKSIIGKPSSMKNV